MHFIQKLKKDTFAEALKNAINVSDLEGIELAKLVPIGEWALNNNELLNSFSEWRHKYMRFFLSQFVASPISTKNYLSNIAISKLDRILFAIYFEGDLIGHLGLSNVGKKIAESDNIIRGKSGGHKDLMYFCERALLLWVFEVVGVNKVTTRVTSKNFLSQSLFKKLGFSLTERLCLKMVLKDDVISYETCTPDEATEKFFLDVLEVEKTDFLSIKFAR